MGEIEKKVERMWDEQAVSGGIYATPQLNVTLEEVERFASGDFGAIPGVSIYPASLMAGVKDKDVLCLASGGGQQTVVFGMLGARVTCADLSQEQLNHDKAAARRYGYDLKTLKTDMRDLSALCSESFDLVCQPVSACFIADLAPLYREAHRVLRPDGRYCVQHCNPAVYPACFAGGDNGWDGKAYRLADPYRGGAILMDADGREDMTAGEPTGEYRHLLIEIFGQLIRSGFRIEEVVEDPRHGVCAASCEPGSYEHSLSVVAAYFAVVSRKTR